MMRSRSFTTGFALAGLVGAAILMALCVSKGEAPPSNWFWLLTVGLGRVGRAVSSLRRCP